AADSATLDLLADHGLRFTILSPYQAKRTKFAGDEKWCDVTGGKMDPTRPYKVNLPSGRSLAVFFYDGPISQAIAFEGVLKHGKKLATRFGTGLSGDDDRPQLVHVATDGETCGHHPAHGDMARAFALSFIDANKPARPTN